MNDNKKITIPTSFDPTRPPPMFFQQPIASSVPHQSVSNHGDNRRFIQQVHFLKQFLFDRCLTNFFILA